MTFTKLSQLAVLCCLPVLLCSCDKGGKKVQLKFRYSAGDVLTYEQTTKGAQAGMVGDSITSSQSEESTSIIKYEIQAESTDSLMIVRQTGRTDQHTFNRLDSTTVDTTHESPPFSFTITPNGKVVDFVMDSAADSATIHLTRSFIEQSFPAFPVGEVSQGFTWAQNSRVAVGDIEYDASTHYEILSFARELGYDCAVIAYEGNLRLPVDPTPSDSLQYRGMSFVTTKGVIYFAYRDGLMILQKERWLKNGRFEMLDSERGDSLFVAIEWDIVVKLIDRSRSDK